MYMNPIRAKQSKANQSNPSRTEEVNGTQDERTSRLRITGSDTIRRASFVSRSGDRGIVVQSDGY